MNNIKIICDSLSDIPEDLIEKYNIDVVPLTIIIEGREYKQNEELTNKEFYKLIRSANEMPKTSQATYAQFYEVFSKYINEGKSILYISASSKATGTCQSAMMARNDLNGDIHIFDSLNLSFGCGCQVLAACEMRERGYSIEQIIEKLDDIRKSVHVYFEVDTLEYLKKGGRLSASKAAIGTMLSLKPILQVEDYGVDNIDIVRGTKKAIHKLLDLIKSVVGDELESKRIAIGHGDNISDFEKLKKSIIDEFGEIDFLQIEIGACIGSHAGPDTIGVCIWDK